MKISVAIPVLDLSAPAPSAPVDSAASKGFETAVQAVANKAGDRGGAPTGHSPPAPPERERVSDGRKNPAAPANAQKSKDDDTSKDETAPDAAGSATPAGDLLGRLLAAAGLASGAAAGTGTAGKDAPADDGAAGLTALSDADVAALAAAAAAAEEGTTFDGALEERLVITPLGSGGTDGKAQGPKDKTGVGLEVLHMETHFEPRVDDVVLVEGAATVASKTDAKAGADALGGVLSTIRLATASSKGSSERARADEAGTPAMRFDEALARLSNGESAADADADASDRRGAKDRRADAKVADDVRQGASRVQSDVTVEVDAPIGSLAPASMTSQIADRIVDAFRPQAGQQGTADPAPGQTHLRMTAGGAALKTLTIQLQPENLGKLEVSMRLVEGRLTLELAASSAETAVALANDRAGLKKLLEHAGFSMDEASISIVARDSAAAMTRSSASPDAGGQGQPASGDGRGGSEQASSGERGSARDSGSQSRDPAPGQRGRGEAESHTASRKRSSVFL